MSDAAGVAMIVGGFAGVALVGFGLRRRLPSPVVYALVAGLSMVVGLGALVVQDHVTTADWIVTMSALALLGPVHLRFLVGPFGPSAKPGTAATEPV